MTGGGSTGSGSADNLRTSAAHVFVEDLDRPELTDEDVDHLARSLRLRAGEVVSLSDGAGRWRLGRFGDATVEPVGEIHVEPAPRPELLVGFGLLKGDRSELVAQKLTELGVDVISPFVSVRSVVRVDPSNIERVDERLRRVVRSAAMQSRRVRLPLLQPVRPWPDVVASTGGVRADIGGAPPDLDHPAILIGPEGGWDDTERAAAPASIGLGPGVLRAETASIAAGTVLSLLRAKIIQPAAGL